MTGPMTPPEDVAAVAAGLTQAQRTLIPHMSDGEWVFPARDTAAEAGIPVEEARKTFRGLRALGLAKYGPLYSEDESRPAGSGTWLTPLGLAVRAHLQQEQQ